jgi:hypothetical protein
MSKAITKTEQIKNKISPGEEMRVNWRCAADCGRLETFETASKCLTQKEVRIIRVVITGLVPVIQNLFRNLQPWIAGTSPAMTRGRFYRR